MEHLGLGDEYSSEMESFLTRVQELGGLSSHQEADRVVRATLAALGERITGGQMADLAPGLPRELRPEIDHARGQAMGFEKNAFLDQITGDVDTVDIEKAEMQARGVLRAVYERAPEGEIDDTLAQLPPELAALFE